MKRIMRLAWFALCFAPALAHAFPFPTLPRVWTRLPAMATDTERVNRLAPRLSGLDLVLSTFDKSVIGKFRAAWQRVGSGTLPWESVVLILKMSDGGYSTYMPNPTNQFKRFTFAWDPATIAIVHTHPNDSPAHPEDGDITTADKFKVPVFTITSRGMFVYDPATRKTTRVLDGILWRDDTAWEQVHARLVGQLTAGGR